MLHKFQALPTPGRQRGFTIVELVIAFIIIGILTLALTPVLTKQANTARINVAHSDVENLSNAEERAAVDTGYLYRPYVLNDVYGGDGIVNAADVVSSTAIDRVQGLNDNALANDTYGDTNLYKNPTYIFISPVTQDFLNPQIQQLQWSKMVDPITETNFNWNGPYINWRRDESKKDWPEDPWGNPYLFFTNKGVIFPPPRSTDPPNSAVLNGGGSNQDTSYPFQNQVSVNVGGTLVICPTLPNAQYPGWGFDRPTWVSMGPNGLPGDGSGNLTDINFAFGQGDDIVYSFGGN